MRTDVKIGVVLGLLVVAGIVIYFSVTNGDGPSTEPGGPDAAAPGKTPSLDESGPGEPSPKPPVEPDAGPLVTLPPAPPSVSTPADPPGVPMPTIADPPGPGGSDPLEPGGVVITPDPGDPADPATPGLPAVPAPPVPGIATTPDPAAPGVLPDPGVGDAPGPVVTVRPPDADPGTPAVDPGRVEPVGPIVPVTPFPAAPGAAGPATEYVVKEGDGLWKIAEAVYGKGWLWSRIAKANPNVDTRTLRVGQKLTIPPPPTPTPGAAAVAADAVAPGGGKYYTVVDGDKGFWQIAEKNYGKGHLWPRIAKANPNVDPRALKIGQKIVIPPLEAAPTDAVVAPGGGAVAVDPIALPPGTRAYTVKSGDTLGAIAAAMYGTTTQWPRIAKANPGINPDALRVGKTLVIPPLTAEAGSSEPAGPPAVAPRPRDGGDDMPRTARRPRPYFD